ncbi:MAG: mechanosensitive ion channel family protein [Thermoplasmata archaeon]|nr:mechanosensitive ion channel family protein [Thermoplasmata archaeon]
MEIKRLGMILIAISVMSLALGAFAPLAQASEGDLNIFPPTYNAQDVDMDSTVVYRWGIYNNGTTPHTVLIDVIGAQYDWTAELAEGDAYFQVGPGEFKTVELTVTSPNSRDYPDNTFWLGSTIRDLVTEEQWSREMGSVTTTITGGAYVPPTQVLGLFDNPLAQVDDSLDNEYGVFIMSLVVWLLIGAAIFFILDPVVKYFTKATETEIDDQVLAIIKGPIFYLIVLYGAVSSLKVLNFSWSIINAIEILFQLTVIVLFAWMALKILKDVLLIWGKKYSENTDTTMDDIALPLFEKVGMVVIALIAMVLILQLFGIDPTMLVAGMGVMGLVIAFAAQDTLGNFISGMFLLTDRPFKVGDLVLMENGDYCRVEQIGMRSTKLYNTFDHDMIVLPNSKIANEKVINLTEPDNKMKIKVIMGVAYDTDLDKAKEIMLTASLNHSDVMQDEDHAPFVRVVEFADSSINIRLYAWVHHLDNQWRVASELKENIFHTFNKSGIEIPFPQHVIHMEKE